MPDIAESNVLEFSEVRSLQDVAPPSPQHTVPIQELLTRSFIARHTRFASIDALIDAGERNANRQGGTGITLGNEWNFFIRSVSHYPDWPALVREAGAEWQMRRIGIVIDA